MEKIHENMHVLIMKALKHACFHVFSPLKHARFHVHRSGKRSRYTD